MPDLDDLLCEDTAGHPGAHYAVIALPGTTGTMRLAWGPTKETATR